MVYGVSKWLVEGNHYIELTTKRLDFRFDVLRRKQ